MNSLVCTQAGERIRRIRHDYNMSIAQFGKVIGVSGQHLGKVEKGVHGLSVNSIIRICQETSVSADYILLGAIDPSKDSATATALSGLSNEQIQIALDIIKRVAQLINTENGNEALIREVASQQHLYSQYRLLT